MKYVELLFGVLWIVWSFAGCANQPSNSMADLYSADSKSVQSVPPKIAEVRGVVRSEGLVSLNNGAKVLVENREGVLYHRVEAILSPEAFSQLSISNESVDQAVDHAIDQIFARLESVHATGLKKYPELGYFTFDLPYQSHLMESLKQFQFPYEVWVDPVVYDLNGYDEGVSRGLNDGMTGHDRMRVSEFIAKAQQDIGEGFTVDGSSVRVGITDTGITLNHETFRSYNGAEEGKERIVYMRDFTREGRVYFNPAARFEVTPVEEDPELLIVNAEVIVTPKLPLMPRGDEFKEIKDLKIRVSPELKQILMNPEQSVKLGILYEELFQAKKDHPDLRGDGRLNTQFLLLYVSNPRPHSGPSHGPDPDVGEVGDVIYFDTRGNGDFRNARPLGDWNRTRATVNLFLERVGFDFQEETLPALAEGKRIGVKSVSLVGFDPGGHGTHVAGILGGARNAAGVQGVAPEVQILMSRVCAINGGCNSPEALLDLVVKGKADVINMSLGSASAFNDGFGVQETLMNRITSLYQVLFFVAAGNAGPGRQTVENPSTARLAISVGAAAHPHMIRTQYQRWAYNGTTNCSEADDFMLLFSSRGPSAAGGMKPNITAPGTALSAAPLNVVPGVLGGVKVISGTSMASPAATGAYALLLDAVRKYNQTHANDPLSDDVFTLRSVLLHSARSFDVFRFDPETGERTEGQYTWIDQGYGMVDLVSAWNTLIKMKSNPVVSPIQQNGESIPLDYEVHVPMKSPNGNVYDGTDLGGPGVPIYGSGLYLDYQSAEKFYPAYITRRLPEKYATPSLITQLRTSHEEFVLKTIYYGSDVAWLKAGTLSQVDCEDSPVSNLMIYGEGATVSTKEQGPEALRALLASALNICVDRHKIRYALRPGDHGALISAYRVKNGQQSVIPSFTVPVYVTVPHHVLKDSYRTEGRIRNFEVKRHYIAIPEGSGQVKVTLEVPPIKTNQDGLPLPGQSCSGVELWVLNEENENSTFKSRQEIVVSNCNEKGAPLPETVKKGAKRKRKATYFISQPAGGLWDLNVVGSYSFVKSDYVLTAEYSSTPVENEKKEKETVPKEAVEP